MKQSCLCVLATLTASYFANAALLPGDTGTAAKQNVQRALLGSAVAPECQSAKDFKFECQATALGQYSDARQYLDQAIAKKGDAAAGMVSRGNVEFRLHEYDKAVNDYTSALELRPHDAGVLSQRGVAFFKLHDYARALADFNAALAIDSSLMDAFLGRGLIYYDQQEYGKAADNYVKLASLRAAANREDAIASYKTAAWLYGQVNREANARASINAALALAPDSAALYATRGRLEREQGDLVASFHDYSRAVQLDPDDVDIRDGRSAVLEQMGQYEAALDEMDRILLTPRQDPELYIDRANILMDLGRDEQARADFETAAQLNPDSPRLLNQRMRLWFYLGDYGAAASDADLWLATKGKVDSDKNVQYILLWRHIVMQRQGVDDREYMSAAMARLYNRDVWPYPLMEYSIGRLDERQMKRAALWGDPQKQNERDCEAAAYVGEKYLAHDLPDQAAENFRIALQICPFDFVERKLATHGLRQITTATEKHR
ncbi:tetratricopeptide repeat protein [Paraburkholderia oxyphila]|uniref:tetratricopeptide repeat protein n=1 Tax=Paraburkholderia oxyphila TaxID=614212 RepID=UPI0005BB54C0|nr:tetratricopeptide repeat protein [Paraburkholderia oxyphila]